MRRTLPIKLLLLALFTVFLLYPLAYIIPGSASDLGYQVRLVSLGDTPEAKLRVTALLTAADPSRGASPTSVRLPCVVKTFPARQPAEDQAKLLREAGAYAEVIEQRRWTAFYFKQALGGRFVSTETLPFVTFEPNSPLLWECLGNSLALAVVTTLATTLLCLPLAYWMTRYRFPGRSVLGVLLLLPLIVPPFVGAIGLQHFLERFGMLNLLLMRAGLLDPGQPIDWLGAGGFFGVVAMQVLSLYPILYLNLAATWANIDPILEDAARNLGAGEGRVFWTITSPLLLPGYFAGASLVFVWAFTDLGTPLVFQFSRVIPVQIYDQVSDPQRTNAVAYCLVVVTLLLTAALFYGARGLVRRRAYLGGGKGAIAAAVPWAGRRRTFLIYLVVLGVTFLASLPHVGVILTAVSERWRMTPLPTAYTGEYLKDVWTNHVVSWSIRNSILYSIASTTFDLILGVAIAWLVVRRPSGMAGLLDGLATLPLALPGLVLAFGYLTCYSNWNLGVANEYLNPVKNPVALLIVAYTIRRVPYVTRSAQAGLQQVPPVLEEAAENLGAGRWRVVRTVTLPLIAANLVAGAVLTFAFAMLEVSDSLMLAREERFFPITRAILGLLMRPDDGDQWASALAVFAMALLTACLLGATVVLGRKMGELFRA
jgi:iron(III) transport system permease protein